MSQNSDTQNTIILKAHDLPLHCSGPQNEAWNGHPRVFLPIQAHSKIECPYCGAVYFLDDEVGHHH